MKELYIEMLESREAIQASLDRINDESCSLDAFYEGLAEESGGPGIIIGLIKWIGNRPEEEIQKWLTDRNKQAQELGIVALLLRSRVNKN